MAQIGLVEAIEQVRAELVDAVAAGRGADIQFPVGQVTLQFQVGLTRSDDTDGKLKLWILELGSAEKYAEQSVQTISVVLEPPVDAQGRPITVSAESADLPG
ncbi:trypco2 family protein [Actinocrispum wychmicini]|uniref:trypco2 family protein n=1 Tax=Actinocrispum wychmicini TaxID=1213861 RepID=UPI001048F8CF|nr:trypco2 family protein [Actinocrispum wychmicini]